MLSVRLRHRGVVQGARAAAAAAGATVGVAPATNGPGQTILRYVTVALPPPQPQRLMPPRASGLW
jgi:hypothetical protein